MIVETLEQDDFAFRANRIEIPASVTGLPFYQKLGMKRADDVMKYNHIEWTEWTVR